MTEGVDDFVAFAHGGQDVLGRPAEFFGQAVGDIDAHSKVAWEGLPLPEIGSVSVHRTLERGVGVNGHSSLEQRGSLYEKKFFKKRKEI